MTEESERERKNRQARERYHRGGAEARKQSREQVARQRVKKLALLNAMKIASGCVDCGYSAHAQALHFDHDDPGNKSFGIARSLTRSWVSVEAEIAKCAIRCANCHAVRSYELGHKGRPRID